MGKLFDHKLCTFRSGKIFQIVLSRYWETDLSEKFFSKGKINDTISFVELLFYFFIFDVRFVFENSYEISAKSFIPIFEIFQTMILKRMKIFLLFHIYLHQRFAFSINVNYSRDWRIVKLEDEKFSFHLKFIFFMKISVSFRLGLRESVQWLLERCNLSFRTIPWSLIQLYPTPFLSIGSWQKKKTKIYIFSLSFFLFLFETKNSRHSYPQFILIYIFHLEFLIHKSTN